MTNVLKIFPLFLCLFAVHSAHAQSVIPATGGQAISADNFATGTWTPLDGPIIAETSPGQLTSGNITLNAPSGFEWDTGGVEPTAVVTMPKGQRIFVVFISRSASQIVFSVVGSSGVTPPNNPHSIEFENLRVRPTQGTLESGEIRNVGSAAPGGTTNYGTLSVVAGADNRIRVEDAPNATGSLIGDLDIIAGNSITVYSNVRDQFNNFKRNEAASWSVQNNTEGVVQGNLTPAGDNRSAVFTGELVGTGNLQAASGGLTPIQSGLITVIPSSPEEMVIQTEPAGTSQEATAGEAFAPQPAIAIVDKFGNVVNDDFTQITAERLAGEGTLQGTTTVTVSNGVATFSDLSHNIANNITLRFSTEGLPSVTSQTVTVTPAAADALIFLDDIPNGSPNTALDPPIEVQIIDAFGNYVSDENVDIELILVSDEGAGIISGNTAVSNSSGLATFSNVQFDEPGAKTIQAESVDNSLQSPISQEFTIAEAGVLAGFQVELTGGGTIGTQTAGQEFNIRITAVDGLGDPLDGSVDDEFTGYVDLTTTGTFSESTDSTQIGPFTAGVFDPHPVTMTEAGDVRIRAMNANGSESGNSQFFVLNPGAANPDSSQISAEPETLVADGISESIITIQLVDEFGNKLTDDIPETVEINLITNNGGSISATTGNGDGTYSATLTASNDVGMEEIGASIDGNAISSGNVIINYTFDDLHTFLIETTGGGNIADQTAGQSFDIRITALDEFNNVVETFDGSGNTVEITSDQTLSTGNGTTTQFTDGILSSHTVTITSSGTATLSARRTGSSEAGTSNPFTVFAAAADPLQSLITPSRNFLQNDGTDNTDIIVQLRDSFANNLTTGGDDVTLSSTAGSLSGITDNNDGTYTATLTAGTNIETAIISGTLNGTDIADDATVFISQFNRWTAQAGGNPGNASDWSNTENWSLGTLPATDQIVLIPAEDINGNPLARFPILSDDNATVVNPTVDFLVIEAGANVTLSNRTLTINQEISGEGSLFGNDGVINLNGNVELSNFIAGSSDIFFSGSSVQTIDGDFTGDNINIQNDVTVNGYFESFSSVNIDTDQTLRLDPGSQFVVIGDLNIDGSLIGNESDFTIGGNINGSDITLNETSLTFNGENPQVINGIETLKSFTIDNPTTVSVQNDLVITDTLDIAQGQLTINSGFNLATNITVGEIANIRMLREIGDASSEPGWRLLSTPLQATYQNFLDETITQGFQNSSLGLTDVNGNSLQPNVLYYDETFEGTDNQRWRSPADALNQMTSAKGHFVYFFGDIDGDNRYNDPFPYTLDVDGAENMGNTSEITLPVTYTAEADTGWNLVGNPYTATVDWDDGTWEKTNMSNAIYIWDEVTNQYRSWNGITGSHGSGKIAPFQGFWVKANGQGSPSLKVRKETKTTAGIFRKSTSSDNRNDEWPVIELQAESGTLQNSTFFTFTDEGQNNIDNYDAYRLLPFDTDTYLEVFTLLNDGTELTINSLPRKFGKPIELPVHIDGVQEGQFLNNEVTLSWPKMEYIPDGWTITLKDLQTGETVNLLEDSIYNFTLSARGKTPPMMNTPQNFKLVEKSKAKSQQARFTITINPGGDVGGIPSDVVLNQNYPNPFNPTTTIQFGIPVEGNVRVDIYDLLGRRVQTVTDQRYQAGFHTVQFDGRSLASGVYFYRLISPEKIMSKRMTLIK